MINTINFVGGDTLHPEEDDFEFQPYGVGVVLNRDGDGRITKGILYPWHRILNIIQEEEDD